LAHVGITHRGIGLVDHGARVVGGTRDSVNASKALPNTASAELFTIYAPVFARSGSVEVRAVPFRVRNRAPAGLCACNISLDSNTDVTGNGFGRQCCADTLRRASSALASVPRAAQWEHCRECRNAARKNQPHGAKKRSAR
jgi:hypothetical protein